MKKILSTMLVLSLLTGTSCNSMFSAFEIANVASAEDNVASNQKKSTGDKEISFVSKKAKIAESSKRVKNSIKLAKDKAMKVLSENGRKIALGAAGVAGVLGAVGVPYAVHKMLTQASKTTDDNKENSTVEYVNESVGNEMYAMNNNNVNNNITDGGQAQENSTVEYVNESVANEMYAMNNNNVNNNITNSNYNHWNSTLKYENESVANETATINNNNVNDNITDGGHAQENSTKVCESKITNLSNPENRKNWSDVVSYYETYKNENIQIVDSKPISTNEINDSVVDYKENEINGSVADYEENEINDNGITLEKTKTPVSLNDILMWVPNQVASLLCKIPGVKYIGDAVDNHAVDLGILVSIVVVGVGLSLSVVKLFFKSLK